MSPFLFSVVPHNAHTFQYTQGWLVYFSEEKWHSTYYRYFVQIAMWGHVATFAYFRMQRIEEDRSIITLDGRTRISLLRSSILVQPLELDCNRL